MSDIFGEEEYSKQDKKSIQSTFNKDIVEFLKKYNNPEKWDNLESANMKVG